MSVDTFASANDEDSKTIGHSKHTAKLKGKSKSHYKHSRYRFLFQICRSCFWCASNLDKSRIMKRCPGCKSNKIGSLPIAVSKIYDYRYND